MPRLIINADDLGVNPQRSHGIFECFEFGVVTSASIIANGSDSDSAARHAKERGLSSGLHLNLTDEYPLSKQADINSLTEDNGMFLGAEKLIREIDEGKVQVSHLEREIRAQVEWMLDTYGMPTHVDGHARIHIHPVVIHALIPIMERYGIRHTRIPCEDPLPPFGYEITAAELQNAKQVSTQALAARSDYEGHDITSTDHFRGLTLHGNASLKNLRHILNKLPEGTTELQVHPGSNIAFGTPFDLDPQRQTELRMLMDESIPELLKEKKIELCTWEDL
jgi:predicted glycoside hydrolase/deacetylase ChbG (UPF0249 family)